jgi:zinc transporter 2
MGIEMVGGIVAHSLAILTDAAHMLSDFSGFAISIFSIWIGTRPANASMSYGYHRAEVIGAMGSILLIWALTVWLIYEAVERVMHPHDVDGKYMLITACIGLFFNIVMGKILHSGGGHHHHGHSHGHHHHGHSHGGHSHGHDHGESKKSKKKKSKAKGKKIDEIKEPLIEESEPHEKKLLNSI